jgi:secretion/DNA translocation related TadE-like protein
MARTSGPAVARLKPQAEPHHQGEGGASGSTTVRLKSLVVLHYQRVHHQREGETGGLAAVRLKRGAEPRHLGEGGASGPAAVRPKPQAEPHYQREGGTSGPTTVGLKPRTVLHRQGEGGTGGPDDRGSATVLGVACLAVLTLLISVGIQLAGAVVRRHELTSAADLAALAAAAHLTEGVQPACDRAAWVVERMGKRLTGCVVSGWEVVVQVGEREMAFGTTNARARAGPTEA